MEISFFPTGNASILFGYRIEAFSFLNLDFNLDFFVMIIYLIFQYLAVYKKFFLHYIIQRKINFKEFEVNQYINIDEVTK